jgi:hypothetical protein
MTIAQAKRARIKAFDLDLDFPGKNGHSAAFAWSA